MFAALFDGVREVVRAATSVGAPEAAGSPQLVAMPIRNAARAAAVNNGLSLKRAGSDALRDVR
jgi:hypothetical protein